MIIPIYKCEIAPTEQKILKECVDRCSKEFGVTLTGNRLTLRWSKEEKLVQVHMIIEHIDDGIEEGVEEGIL